MFRCKPCKLQGLRDAWPCKLPLASSKPRTLGRRAREDGAVANAPRAGHGAGPGGFILFVRCDIARVRAVRMVCGVCA